ncbi:aminotransferase-like domain-containing protein [Anaerovorax sp. IOR16]|uniref:aminotransferase-like domain-containing protein n=1 Tax=Anaerovorax sp. IOR16 TaxID=2773458 RepID=UPI0019D1DBDE|nr:PLP-dependent aminotransferase family protein [Anaerovorax sp. IOR16]
MELTIDRNSYVPVYQQIAIKIKDKILSQELTPGLKLPAERRLAEALNVHRNTVVKAYNVLIAEELVTASRQKPKGYFVGAPKEITDFGKRFFPLEKAFRYEFRRAEKRFNDIYWKSESKNAISFGGIIMDRKLSPVLKMEHVVERIFNNSEKDHMTEFGRETERLKENICRLLTRQNIYVMPKNVQIMAESNQTISYLISLYLREGDWIVAEEPIVPDNFSIFYNRGINIATVPMEEDGMRMDMLEDAIRKYKPKFIYTQPNFHNPTGITMSLKKRQTLLQLANTYNIPIIEEDYQQEFSYTEKILPSLYALDANKLVIYVYSYTLIFPYMMKIGYAVGPSDFIDMMGYALSVDETIVSGIGQYFLNEYIDSGEYDRHVKVVRSEYSARLNLLCSELDKIADKGITYQKPSGGLLLWCTLPDDINERELCKLAEEKGVLVVPGWVFYENSNRKKGHIRMCFSNVTNDEICRSVILLGEALDECRQQKNAKNRKEKENEQIY